VLALHPDAPFPPGRAPATDKFMLEEFARIDQKMWKKRDSITGWWFQPL